MSENATPYYTTLPPVLTTTARVRKSSADLTALLTQEYRSRYGCWPSGTAWRREPWCHDYVRVMEGAVVIPDENALDAAAVVCAVAQEVEG